MADVAHLKSMLRNFRVAELQVLLGYANLNQTGRKSDLLTRAMTVIDNNPSPFLQDKIQHLYQWRNTQHSASRRNYFESETRVLDLSLASAPLERSISLCSPTVMTHFEEFPVAMGHLEQLPADQNIVMEELPFYSVISEIVPSSYLVPKDYSGYQSAAFNFSLSSEQIQKISAFSSSNGRIPEISSTRIHLRFCTFDERCTEQADCWPSSLYLKVNNSMLALPVSASGSGARKCAVPIDITPLCHLLHACVNKIIVSWMSIPGQCFYVAVHEVTKVDSSDLLPRLNNILPPEITKAQISEKLAAGNDGEISAIGLQLSFRCPLGKMQMQIPCRAASCEHLQCFDGWYYIRMNEMKPTWICPICDRPAKLKDLRVDGYFLDILNKEPQVEEVEFREHGEMVVRNMDDDDLNLDSPSPPPQGVACSMPGGSMSLTFPLIDLTSSDDETGSHFNDLSNAGSNAFTPSHPIYSGQLSDRSISPSYYLLTPISNPPGSPQPLQQGLVATPYPQLLDPFQNCSTAPLQHSISCQPGVPSCQPEVPSCQPGVPRCQPGVTSCPSDIAELNDFQQFENGFSSAAEQNRIPDPFDLLGLTNDDTMPLSSSNVHAVPLSFTNDATIPLSLDYNFLPVSPMWSADFDFDETFSDLPTL